MIVPPRSISYYIIILRSYHDKISFSLTNISVAIANETLYAVNKPWFLWFTEGFQNFTITWIHGKAQPRTNSDIKKVTRDKITNGEDERSRKSE